MQHQKLATVQALCSFKLDNALPEKQLGGSPNLSISSAKLRTSKACKILKPMKLWGECILCAGIFLLFYLCLLSYSWDVHTRISTWGHTADSHYSSPASAVRPQEAAPPKAQIFSFGPVTPKVRRKKPTAPAAPSDQLHDAQAVEALKPCSAPHNPYL